MRSNNSKTTKDGFSDARSQEAGKQEGPRDARPERSTDGGPPGGTRQRDRRRHLRLLDHQGVRGGDLEHSSARSSAATWPAAVPACPLSSRVPSSAGFPPVPSTIGVERGTLNEEVCLVTAIPDGSHFTVERDFDGTTQKPHTAGSSVEHCVC